MMKCNVVPRATRATKNTGPSIRGICGWLFEDNKNDDWSGARFKVLFNLPGTTKRHICGEALTNPAFDPKLPYDLPEGGKLLHSTCLCQKHYKIFNKAFEKRFFKIDRTGPISPQSSLSSSPSKKVSSLKKYLLNKKPCFI